MIEFNTSCQFDPAKMPDYDYSDYSQWPEYVKVLDSSRVEEIYIGGSETRVKVRHERLLSLAKELSPKRGEVWFAPYKYDGFPFYEAPSYADMFAPRHGVTVPISLSLLTLKSEYYDLIPTTQVFRKKQQWEL